MGLLAGPDLVALREEPGSRDRQQVGVLADVRRESAVGPRVARDAQRCGIEDFEARGLLELDRLHRAVGADRDREPQHAVELAARLRRIVDRAVLLDLLAPGFLVLRE